MRHLFPCQLNRTGILTVILAYFIVHDFNNSSTVKTLVQSQLFATNIASFHITGKQVLSKWKSKWCTAILLDKHLLKYSCTSLNYEVGSHHALHENKHKYTLFIFRPNNKLLWLGQHVMRISELFYCDWREEATRSRSRRQSQSPLRNSKGCTALSVDVTFPAGAVP